MRKVLLSLIVSWFCMSAYGDDCASYKMRPSVKITTPDWTKSVVQPINPMSLWHGNVIATLVSNYDIVADITSIEDGFCVGLKSVDATIGYVDFLVQIDIRHTPNTCSYNAVLSHEDNHIRAYLSVIDDNREELRGAVLAAADSVMPVFVERAAEIDAAVERLNADLQSHPDIMLIKQKIGAAEEIRNRRIDAEDNGAELRRCFD